MFSHYFSFVLCLILCTTGSLLNGKENLDPEFQKVKDLLYDRPDTAIKIYRQFLDKTDKDENPKLWLNLVLKFNGALHHMGRSQETVKILQEALQHPRLSDYPDLHSQLLIQKFALLDLNANPAEISEILAKAEQLADASTDRLSQAVARIYLGREAHRNGAFDLAGKYISEASQKMKGATEDGRYYSTLYNFASIYTEVNSQKIDHFIDILYEITNYSSTHKLHFLGVLTFHHLAESLAMIGKPLEAQQAYQTSKQFAETIGDELGVAYSIVGLSKYDIANNKFDVAINQLQEAKSIMERIGDKEALLDVNRTLANLLDKIGESQKALSLIQAVRADLEGNAGTQLLIPILEEEARIAENANSLPAAVTAYKRAHLLRKEIYSTKNKEIANRYFAEYEVERREEKNKLLQQKNRIQALEIENKDRTQFTMRLTLGMVIIVLMFFIIDFYRIRKRNQEIRNLHQYIEKNVLQRFLPPVIVQEILEGKSRLDDSAKSETVTVLFTDLCGFTRATDRLGPEKISRVLNDFFLEMTEVIFEHNGTIDKFIGDAIMVIFGAPSKMSPEEQAQRAIACAEAMHKTLETLNENWKLAAGENFAMRTGIHQGPAVVGSFGGPRRQDYTVIGNTVNLASRIVSIAKPNSIFVTDEVRELADRHYSLLGNFEIKGFEQEIPLYSLEPKQSDLPAA